MTFQEVIYSSLANIYDNYKDFTIKPNSKRGQSLTFTVYDENIKPILMAKFFNYLSGLEDVFLDYEMEYQSINQLLENINLIEEQINSNVTIEEIVTRIEFQLRCFNRYIKACKIESLQCFPKLVESNDNIKINDGFYGFLIEEFVDGQTLEELLPIDEEHELTNIVFNFLSQMGVIIKKLGDHKIVHRDISPDNLMISGGQVILIDPGIIKMESEGPETKTGLFIGKHLYASPEQINYNSKHVNFSSDLYSTGIIALEIVLGYNPIKKMIDDGSFNPHTNLVNKFDRELFDDFFIRIEENSMTLSIYKIIKKMIQVNNTYRYDSINTFIQSLEIVEERAGLND